MHEQMKRFVTSGEAPGIVTGVMRRGAVEVDAVGTKAVGGTDPVRRDTIFRIASMTKPITGAATMILVDDKKLQLDEPVDRLLPELANRRVLNRVDAPLDDTVLARRPITVRDLLTFTMGLGVVFAPPGTVPVATAMEDLHLGQGMPNPSKLPAPDEWMRRLGTLPLIHQPGEKWMYNTGCDVLGVLVARASGKSFEAFLRERIFEPLGMKDTAFHVPPEKLDRLATSYRVNFESGAMVPFDEPSGQWSRPPAFASGAAGLVSTVDDCLAFGQMMLQKGRWGDLRVLSESAVEAMTRDQLTEEQKASPGALPGLFPSHGWGLGMAVVAKKTTGEAGVGAFGWDGGLGTSWRMDPSNGIVGVLLTQKAWTSPRPPEVCREFWRAVYASP